LQGNAGPNRPLIFIHIPSKNHENNLEAPRHPQKALPFWRPGTPKLCACIMGDFEGLPAEMAGIKQGFQIVFE
jgi:hypothetical protein